MKILKRSRGIVEFLVLSAKPGEPELLKLIDPDHLNYEGWTLDRYQDDKFVLKRERPLMAEVEQLEAEAVALREILENVEWIFCNPGWICPWCGRAKEDGHAPDCGRQAALATDAGRTLLERLRRMEAERDDLRARLMTLTEMSRVID